MTATPPLVLFDLDGTLVRLPVDIDGVRVRLAEHFSRRGVDVTFRPILPAIEQAVAAVGDETELAAAYAIIAAAELEAAERAIALPGAADALASCGAACGIVTNNAPQCVSVALAASGLPAVSEARVWGRVADRPPKPAPDGLLEAARALAGSAPVVWYVGDSATDALAANAAAQVHPARWRCALVGEHWRAGAVKPDLAAANVGDAVRRIANHVDPV